MTAKRSRAKHKNNIISMYGAAVPGVAAVDDEVVAELNRLLTEARDGTIAGFAIAIVRPTGISTTWAGRPDMHRLLAAVSMLTHRISTAVAAEDE